MASFTGTVTEVLSGDTLTISISGGGSETVKLIGIAAPAQPAPGAAESGSHLTTLVQDDSETFLTTLTFTQDETLELPGSASTKLYWMFDGATNLNVQMATDGYAKYLGRVETNVAGRTLVDFYNNNLYISDVEAAASTAEAALTGLWGTVWKTEFVAKASTPYNAATDVPIDRTISITFSHNIDNDSLYANSSDQANLESNVVFLYDSNMNTVACDVDSSGAVITINPTLAMVTSTDHVVQVWGVDLHPIGVKNTNGDFLAATQNFFFTTGVTVSLDITQDQATSLAGGTTVYKSVPIVQRPLEIISTSPLFSQLTNLSAMPTMTIAFNEALVATGTNAYNQAGTIVTCESAGIFSSARTAISTPTTLAGANTDQLQFTPAGTIATNTRYIVTISADLTSTNGIQMQNDVVYTFTGTYSPLWVESERVKLGLGEFGEDLEDDFIHRVIYKNCSEINNRMSVSSALWYHDELATLRSQHEILQIISMLKDSGVSTTVGISFTQRVDSAISEALSIRLRQIEKEIHALVNTEIYADDATLARSMILASNLSDDGKLDQISMNRFYPRANSQGGLPGRYTTVASSRAGGGTRQSSFSTSSSSENPSFANTFVTMITSGRYW